MENLEHIFKKILANCEWVKQQNFQSLKPYLLKEAIELHKAIDNNDRENIIEELGDILMQVIFYAAIAPDFSLKDIEIKLKEKLIRRNPHIFNEKIAKEYTKATDKIAFSSEQWEKAKLLEKKL